MSVDNVRAFFELVQKDDSIRERMRSVNAGDSNEATRAIIRIAAELGFKFSESDYRAATRAHMGPPNRPN